MQLPENVSRILDALKSEGFEAYVVGGAVRNAVLGIDITDYDITTSATPDEILRVFSDYNTFAPGIKHGTVCVEREGEVFEITSFRSDGEYKDNRHPDGVTFVRSVADDLKRRDFTVNAMCFDGYNFLDMFGGREDCKEKIIRCIGDPDERFCEDALRILRALRFASKLGFKIEENTKRAVFARKRLLNNISAERLQSELVQILTGEYVREVLLEYAEVIAVFIPEILPTVNFIQYSKYHAYDVYGHTAVAVANSENDAVVRLAVFLHDIAKPSCFTRGEDGIGHFYGHADKSAMIAELILNRLKFSSSVSKEVVQLVKYHDYPIFVTGNRETVRKMLVRALNKFGEQTLRRIIKVKMADNSAKRPELMDRVAELEQAEREIDVIIAERQCISLKDLAIDGNDVAELGLKGKQIGRALEYALDKVIEGEVVNERDELINAVKGFFKEDGLL